MRGIISPAGALFTVSLLVASGLPAMAQGVGAIGGTVTDSTGAVLPGAIVTLTSSQGTVGGNQETVSDTRGAYQFLRLVPGTYAVKAAIQGFRTVEQRQIVVNADATARADLQLPIGQLEESVLVSGESPQLLNPPVQTEAPMHPQVTLPPHEAGMVTQWLEDPSRSA